MKERDELAGLMAGVVNGPANGTPLTRNMAIAVLDAGYRRPREVATAEMLEGLANGVILRAGRITYEHHNGMFNGVDGSCVDSEYISLPAAVLYEPTP